MRTRPPARAVPRHRLIPWHSFGAPVSGPRPCMAVARLAREAASTSDPELQYRIACGYPELHPALARNPRLYEDLRRWLSESPDPLTQTVLSDSHRGRS